jgi:hypothetical protein
VQDRKPTLIFLKDKYRSKRYRNFEIELLSAIETCKFYKNILLGYHLSIIVFTDHNNNTFNVLKALDRVLLTLWLLLLEEYRVKYEHLPEKIVIAVADDLSRLKTDSL